MFGPKELNLMNTLTPDLTDISESARIQYAQAEEQFEMVEARLRMISQQIESGKKFTKEEIYAKCQNLVQSFAYACEAYLKALYLYEHKDGELSCEELWNVLASFIKEDRTRDDKVVRDENNNVVYFQPDPENNNEPLKHPDGTVIYVYAKVDENKELIRDERGNPIYEDKYGNIYSFERKGRKVTTDGHALDRLIELLSPESKILLETRLLSISMNETEKNSNVSIIDRLLTSGIIPSNEKITHEQYLGWLDQHKKSFEQSRYAGQKKMDVNVEFMHHLATQIRAVAQYKMKPTKRQQIEISDDEISQIPADITELINVDKRLLSPELIKLVASHPQYKEKIISLINSGIIQYYKGVRYDRFNSSLTTFSKEEMAYIAFLISLKDISKKDIKEELNKNISLLINCMSMDANSIVGVCLELKNLLKVKIDENLFKKLFELISNKKLNCSFEWLNIKRCNIPYDNMKIINNNELKDIYNNNYKKY